jgi:hypothetical protein
MRRRQWAGKQCVQASAAASHGCNKEQWDHQRQFLEVLQHFGEVAGLHLQSEARRSIFNASESAG